MSSSFRLGFDLIGLQAPLYLRILWYYVSFFVKIILTSLYLVEGLAWWEDWPFTWWTYQLLSFSALTLLVGSCDP